MKGYSKFVIGQDKMGKSLGRIKESSFKEINSNTLKFFKQISEKIGIYRNATDRFRCSWKNLLAGYSQNEGIYEKVTIPKQEWEYANFIYLYKKIEEIKNYLDEEIEKNSIDINKDFLLSKEEVEKINKEIKKVKE